MYFISSNKTNTSKTNMKTKHIHPNAETTAGLTILLVAELILYKSLQNYPHSELKNMLTKKLAKSISPKLPKLYFSEKLIT